MHYGKAWLVVTRPVHKYKQTGLLTSLEKLHPGMAGNDEALYDPDLLLQGINFI